jgi:MYXO-CTERM domain-containing protein
MAVELIARQAQTAAGGAVLAVEAVTVVRDARLPFVRTGPTTGGAYLHWASGCALIGIAAEGTRAIAGDNEVGVFDGVLATWNDAVEGCSYMSVVSTGELVDREVGTDRVNVLKFRDVTWFRPALDDDPPRCYSPLTAGITTVVYVDDPGSDRDGEIVDADIELNGVDFAISVGGVTLDDGSCLADLANTLTHEIGHLLGLEHTCNEGGPDRVDDQGNPVPACATNNDPDILDATMWAYQDCGETKKASLTPDDIDAICAVYPPAADPQSCEAPDDSAGCCDAGSGPGGPVALSVLVALGMIRRRQTR